MRWFLLIIKCSLGKIWNIFIFPFLCWVSMNFFSSIRSVVFAPRRLLRFQYPYTLSHFAKCLSLLLVRVSLLLHRVTNAPDSHGSRIPPSTFPSWLFAAVECVCEKRNSFTFLFYFEKSLDYHDQCFPSVAILEFNCACSDSTSGIQRTKWAVRIAWSAGDEKMSERPFLFSPFCPHANRKR